MEPNKLIQLEMTESKQKMRIIQLIIHELIEILELYPQYTVAQHLDYLCDIKGFYRFTDDKVIKEIQRYRNKLEDEILAGQEEYFETEL